jgi:type IV pilus assembly protein PilB
MARVFSKTRQERETGPIDAAAFEVRPGGRRLGELLVERSLINQNQLVEALMQQSVSGKRLGALLVELGALDERDLASALADQAGIDVADLRHDAPQPEALELVPEAMARSLAVVPLRRSATEVEVACADPRTPDLMDQLIKATGMRVRLLVGTATEIHRAIDSSYRALGAVDRHVRAFEATESLRKAESPLRTKVSEDAPVAQVVNLVITQALRDRASDIHIEPQEGRVRVRYRIDGALHDVLPLPEGMGPALVSRLKIMADMNIVERRRAQDGQITTEIDGRPVDIRVATTPTIWGEKTVLRLLDRNRPLYHLDELGMPADTHEVFSQLAGSPFGMVVCTGPTGSGKTTTLYATLSEINETQRNVMTIEDPVEYVFPAINQIQINEQAGVTFADGLRSILRQDPDIILVGEMRDVETARIAVQSALTGHFVLSSMHATDSVSAVHRFLDMGIEPFLIASSVIGVVAQRLVRRICPYCRVTYNPTPEELAFYNESGGSPKQKFWHGEGCNFCSGTGYHDRVGVYELLRMNNEVRELVVARASHDAIRAAALVEGMRPLRQEGLRLVADDVTTISEVVRGLYSL